MKIVCQNCGANYRIADEKIQGKKVFKIKCKRCGDDVLVHLSDIAAESPDEATRMMDTAGGEPVWHVAVNGDQQGPFTPDQVRELFTQGAIDADTYVWREGFDGWLPLHSVDELSAVFSSASAPVPSDLPPNGGDLFASMAPPPEEPPAPIFFQTSAPAPSPDPGLFAADPAARPAAAASPAKARAKTNGGDLFATEAIQHESSRPLFSSEPEPGPEPASPAMAQPGTHPSADGMTGQRNENSVLFSLASLQQLSTSRENPSANANAGSASGDASGLIDINKLAGALGNPHANSPKKSSVDDILTVGASSGLGSPLAAPLLAPVAVPVAPVTVPVEPQRPAAGARNMTGAIIAAAVIVMVGIVGAAYVFTSRNEQVTATGPVASASSPTASPTQAIPEAAPTPTPAAPAPTTAVPTPAPAAPTPAAGEPTAPSTHEHSGSTERDRERRAERRERDRERPAPTSAPTPVAAPSRPAAAPAPARRAQGGSIEDLMGQVTGPGNHPSGNNPSSGNNSNTASVPETPSRSAVGTALRGIGPSVRACGTGTGGTATVEVVFNSNGGVNTANVHPPYSGTPVGSCIARAVRRAHIPPFSRPTFQVTYPFPLQ